MCAGRQLWPFVGLLIFGSIFFWRNPYSARFRKVNGLEAVDSEQQRPVQETVVLAGLVVCEVMMLWAGCANSLTSLTLSISVISGVYFLLAFALLLIHQFAPNGRYAYDRAVLYCAATYAGCVILVSYLYQLHAYDSESSWLEWAGLSRGATWKVLLSHSVVLFVCAFELRLMRRRLVRASLFGHAYGLQRYWLSSTSSSALQSLLHVAFLLFFFLYQVVMIHTDKLLVITLFLAATRYVSVMGAWYIACALAILLVPGRVFLKSSVVLLSAMLFVLAIFVAQIPLASFASHHELFSVLGLRLNDTDFGVLVVEHLAVLLMARLYMTTDGWLHSWGTEQKTAHSALAAVIPPSAAQPYTADVESAPPSPVARVATADSPATHVMAASAAQPGNDLRVPPVEEMKEEVTFPLSQHVIDLSPSEELRPTSSEATVVEEPLHSPQEPIAPRSTTTASSSSWVLWLYRGLFVDSSSVFFFFVHLVHYFSFYHLTLVATMIAAYSNASTIFGLALTVLTGLVLVVGQASIDRWWGWLVLCCTVEVLAKYALSVLNLQDNYSCLDACSKWQQWWAHDDHLHDWDVVVLILAGIHYGQLQQQSIRERQEAQLYPLRPAPLQLDSGAKVREEEKSFGVTEEESSGELPPPPSVPAVEAERLRLLYVPCPPHHVEVSYHEYDRSVTSYFVHDFTRHTRSSSAVCHFLVFRCLLYLVLFLLLSVSTAYFNVIQSLYLTLELGLLYLGDSLLERPERARLLLHFQVVVYAAYLLRFLYLIPVFDIATTATAWSTVLGFYHVHETSPPPPYAVSGVVGGVLYVDIIVMVLLLVQTTVLSRPEMIFVRCALARKRMVAELRRAAEEKRRTEERERTMERLREEQRARVERLHEVQQAHLVVYPIKPLFSHLTAHPWLQQPSPVGSRGAVNEPMEAAPPSSPKAVDARTTFAPPAPSDHIQPDEVAGKVEASTASDDEVARGLGARYTLAALTAHQQDKARSDLVPTASVTAASPASRAGEDSFAWDEEKGSAYGPPRIMVPASVLRQQLEAIQRHEVVALHPLPGAEFRQRMWLWWWLTNNRVVDFFTDHLGIYRDEWTERKRLRKRRKAQREHEVRVLERKRRRELRERRLRRRPLLAAPLSPQSDAPSVQVQITPSLFIAEDVRVSIVPCSSLPLPFAPLTSQKSGEPTAATPTETTRDEEDDDPVVQQRRLDWARAPSWVVQLGQLWTLLVCDGSILWICVLFFANCQHNAHSRLSPPLSALQPLTTYDVAALRRVLFRA